MTTASPDSFPDVQFPAEPYPGARPECSFVHENGRGTPLTPAASGGWQVGRYPLDAWLAERGAEPSSARLPVLAYGSNACPSKITWLREAHGLSGPVVVVRATVAGMAAVWAAGFRVVDDQRPATLSAADPSTRETHAVWLATSDQIRALDRCEGRGERYDLARLHSGEVTAEGGTALPDVLAYVARSPARMPLLVDGAPVRCADVGQDAARRLRGTPATSDGLRHTVM